MVALAWHREMGYLSETQMELLGIPPYLVEVLRNDSFENIVQIFAEHLPTVLIIDHEEVGHLRDVIPGTRMDS